MKCKSLLLVLSAWAAALALSSCTKTVNQATLSVEPATALTFKASGNMDVKLAVSTSASAWEFSAPEWVVARKEANTLIVNVRENTAETANVGRITFSAGDANPVNINVMQEAFVGSGNPSQPAEKTRVRIIASSESLVAKKGQQTQMEVYAVIPSGEGGTEVLAKEEIKVELTFDAAYVSEYNYINKASTVIFPEDKITSGKPIVVIIPKGKSRSESVSITFDADALEFGTEYLIPFQSKTEENVASENARINAVLMRQSDRTIKNVVYFEVNDTNPLNALEYRLEDGTPFFDAVILFAANINYSEVNDVVYLHNNPNVQALLDETDVYLQPLRKAGIKVYLGLLGNHDASGLAQLSDYGAHEWAQEVAEACRKYKLDGVNLDDEYSANPIAGNKWFSNPPSSEAAGRLMYELKMALKNKCSWPTEVSHFDFGNIFSVPSIVVDGVKHTPSEFVDFHVPNYGSKSSAYGDLTNANGGGRSIELNLKYLPRGDSWADDLKNRGYGWCMWFAFDPSGTGNIKNNYDIAFPLFQRAAQSFYGQKVSEPKGVYNKIAEGKYDPKRYER